MILPRFNAIVTDVGGTKTASDAPTMGWLWNFF
jgi:hypothetical protein